MHIQASRIDDKATLRLDGRFQFDSHRECRAAYDPWLDDPAVRRIAVDFSRVAYLDSSALGMLLLLKEKAASLNKSVELAGAQGAVRQVLDVANFARLFIVS